MEDKFSGIFSLSLKSAELQLSTLFDEIGGKKTIKFLDQLGKLERKKQEVALETFSEILSRLVDRDDLEVSDQDTEGMDELEKDLYNNIMSDINMGLNQEDPQLKLVEDMKSNEVIDLNKVRDSKAILRKQIQD